MRYAYHWILSAVFLMSALVGCSTLSDLKSPEREKGPVVFDRWWPICLFIDDKVSHGNEIVKGAVDMAAACGVALIVWPVTIKSNYPRDPTRINAAVKKGCNIIDGADITRGSALTLVRTPSPAATLCGNLSEAVIAACSELGPGNDISEAQRQRMKGSGHFGGDTTRGTVSAGIVSPIGWDAAVVAHEAQGHGQMRWPNGAGAGVGIGLMNDRDDETIEVVKWTSLGCARMRETALPNKKRYVYDPERSVYYVRQGDPQLQYDLLKAQPIFRWGLW